MFGKELLVWHCCMFVHLGNPFIISDRADSLRLSQPSLQQFFTIKLSLVRILGSLIKLTFRLILAQDIELLDRVFRNEWNNLADFLFNKDMIIYQKL